MTISDHFEDIGSTGTIESLDPIVDQPKWALSIETHGLIEAKSSIFNLIDF